MLGWQAGIAAVAEKCHFKEDVSRDRGLRLSSLVLVRGVVGEYSV